MMHSANRILLFVPCKSASLRDNEDIVRSLAKDDDGLDGFSGVPVRYGVDMSFVAQSKTVGERGTNMAWTALSNSSILNVFEIFSTGKWPSL